MYFWLEANCGIPTGQVYAKSIKVGRCVKITCLPSFIRLQIVCWITSNGCSKAATLLKLSWTSRGHSGIRKSCWQVLWTHISSHSIQPLNHSKHIGTRLFKSCLLEWSYKELSRCQESRFDCHGWPYLKVLCLAMFFASLYTVLLGGATILMAIFISMSTSYTDITTWVKDHQPNPSHS